MGVFLKSFQTKNYSFLFINLFSHSVSFILKNLFSEFVSSYIKVDKEDNPCLKKYLALFQHSINDLDKKKISFRLLMTINVLRPSSTKVLKSLNDVRAHCTITKNIITTVTFGSK